MAVPPKETDEVNALDAWRRLKNESKNPAHWKKPQKDSTRPSIGETIAEIKKYQNTRSESND